MHVGGGEGGRAHRYKKKITLTLIPVKIWERKTQYIVSDILGKKVGTTKQPREWH